MSDFGLSKKAEDFFAEEAGKGEGRQERKGEFC